MPAPPTVEFIAEFRDYVALYEWHLGRSPMVEQTYRRNWRNGIIAGVLVAGGFISVAYFTAPDPATAMRRAAFWAVFYAVIWPVFAFCTLRRRAFHRKLMAQTERAVRAANPPVGSVITVQLTDDGVVLAEASGTAERRWDAVRGITDAEDAVYFEFDGGGGLRIPARAFPDAAARQAFVDEARARVAAAGGAVTSAPPTSPSVRLGSGHS